MNLLREEERLTQHSFKRDAQKKFKGVGGLSLGLTYAPYSSYARFSHGIVPLTLTV
jgi:hypothetical protein